MSNIGKYVVFWPAPTGTNTHHYFDTFEEAEKYCGNARTSDPSIAYVVFESMLVKEVTKMEDMVERIKSIELPTPKETTNGSKRTTSFAAS